jgi:DNA-binding winged helix-turn-helix (wHTH) protein
VQFLFAGHTLDTDRRELRRGPEPIAVEPQVFDLLIYLVAPVIDHDGNF